MRRRNWVIVGFMAIMAITTALMVQRSTAQEDDWTAIFYDRHTGEWWIRAKDGSGNSTRLSIPASSAAVNNDGTQMAYCVTSSTGQATFHLFDLEQQADLLTSDLGPAFECQISRSAFTPDGTRVWVGLSGSIAADQPAWQLVEVQASDGAVLSRLDSNSPFASIVTPADGPILPTVLATDGTQVIFIFTTDGTESIVGMPPYSWKPDALSTVLGWGAPGVDGILLTGETIWPVIDPAVPVLLAPDFIPAYNTVYHLDADLKLIPIYVNTDWIIRDVAWVNRGQQVAVGLISPADVTPSLVKWVLVNRDGSVVEHDPVEATNISVMDSRDGYVTYVTSSNPDHTLHTVLQRFIGDDGQEVASFDQESAPQLWWVTPSAPLANLPPFMPFGAGPTATGMPTLTPAAGITNTPTGGFTSTPSQIAGTVPFTPTPTVQQAATNSSVRTATPIPVTNTAAPGVNRTATSTRVASTPTNTRAASTPTNTVAASTPSATSGIRPPSSRTSTPSSGGNASPTNTQVRPPATATTRPVTNTPRPSSTFTPAPTNTRPPANTSAPGEAATSTPRRGQLASSTPNTGPTSRPVTNTPRPSSTLTRTPTFTPSRTFTPAPTRTPTMTFTATRVVVPSKTPLPTTGGLPSKTPISGPTSTLSYGGNQTMLIITNNAGTELCEIYFTLNTESTWGENYLEDGTVLANGAALLYPVEPGIYDIKVFDCFSNSLEEYGFDLQNGTLMVEVSSTAITSFQP